jgi:phosphopantothenoylcysteine decarboxylase/phosphopantothenate--cysteine ligase
MKKVKNILLIITGGIAAYKSLELIRRLKDQGINVTCILTKSGSEFVTPLSVASLSGNHVYSDLFNLTDENKMGHIQLSREADLILVAPATTNTISKMAYGSCDDLASTVLMATNKQVFVVPAMNVRMWHNPATQRNIQMLIEDGVKFIGPEKGDMACGEYGLGRMSETEEIINSIVEYDVSLLNQPLKNLTALITAGPTKEQIDPVRFISNESSGKQGYAIAQNLFDMGAKTTLITGPTNIPLPDGPSILKINTAEEMLEASEKLLPVDIAVCAAAVSDYKVSDKKNSKIKKVGENISLELSENPDILKRISNRNSNRPKLVVGFAAETENLKNNATSKLLTKGCDWILANDVSSGNVFGDDENQITFISKNKTEKWDKMSKNSVAKKLSSNISEYFSS